MGNKQNDIKNKQNQILHFDWIQDMMERNTNSSCYINILLWRLGFFSIYNLVHIRWGVREDIGAWVMRLLDCMLFIQNKTRRVSTTLWCNSLPLIIFSNAFHKSLTKPNLYTNFLLQPNHALSIATFISKAREHEELLVTSM